MSLRGKLGDYGMADIFQVLAYQVKSGVLLIRYRDVKLGVYCQEGQVVGTRASRRRVPDYLGELMRRAGVINQATLDMALAQQDNKRSSLGQILVSKGLVERSTVEHFARLQTAETVRQLFGIKDGTYEFSTGDGVLSPAHAPIRLDILLMDGIRQAEEWPQLVERLGAFNTTFIVQENLPRLVANAKMEQKPPADPDDFLGDIDSSPGVPADPRLKNIQADEMRIFEMIGPRVTITDMIDRSWLGEFATCSALVHLLDAGIISKGAPLKPRLRLTQQHFTNPALQMTIAFLLACGLCAVARWGGLFQSKFYALKSADTFVDQSLRGQLSLVAMHQIHGALAVYHASSGVYPDNLASLVEEGFLDQGDLQFPWQHPYYYARKNETYVLYRPIGDIDP